MLTTVLQQSLDLLYAWFLGMAVFLKSVISQGRVATCGGIFSDNSTVESISERVLKVSIWRSYGQE